MKEHNITNEEATNSSMKTMTAYSGFFKQDIMGTTESISQRQFQYATTHPNVKTIQFNERFKVNKPKTDRVRQL